MKTCTTNHEQFLIYVVEGTYKETITTYVFIHFVNTWKKNICFIRPQQRTHEKYMFLNNELMGFVDQVA